MLPALNAAPWWAVALGSSLLTLLFLAAVLPDHWAMWLVARRNVPTELLPFGVVALVIGVAILAWALIQAFGFVTVSPVVWLLLAFGVLILLIWWFTR